MNPTSAASPISVRLVCRATRLWCTVTDASTSAHVAQCDACQRHFADVSALSLALRTEASETRTTLDAAAIQRTWRAVRDAQATQSQAFAESRNGRQGFTLLAGLTAVAALAVAAILIQPRQQSGNSLPRVQVASISNPPVSPEAVQLVEAMQSWSQQLSESVVPSAGELAANNPLQAEISSVYADARAALDFLALNFLPVKPSSSEPGSRG